MLNPHETLFNKAFKSCKENLNPTDIGVILAMQIRFNVMPQFDYQNYQLVQVK